MKIITCENEEEWTSVIKSFDNYDVYYLLEYVKAFSIHGDGEPILIYYQNQNLQAINVVMRRGIEHNVLSGYYDYATPYGYGGFLLKGNYCDEDLDILNSEYIKHCRENKVVSEFVRFHPLLNNQNALYSIYDIVKHGKTVTLELHSKEYIWKRLNKKNRNMIRKAQKNNVKIYCGRSEELMCQFVDMYNKTMRKDQARQYYYFNASFYESIMKELKNHFLIFYSEYNGKIISMAMILFCNHNLHYHFSASDINYHNLASMNLLLYEVACWGSENGYTKFHLGGGLGGKEDSLFKFKKAFTMDETTDFCIGKKIFDTSIYELLCKDNGSDKVDFFPMYRAE